MTTVAGNGVQTFSGDGGPGTSASFNSPYGLALDATGSLLIAEYGSHRVRKLAASTGVIMTLVGTGVGNFSGDGGPAVNASLNNPSGVAVDNAGNVFIADSSNHRIRRVTAGSKVIATLAGTGVAGFSGDGGPATSARLNVPRDVAVHGSGSVFIADFNNNRIRRVDAGGVITTVAGTGEAGFSGDGGPATSASLNRPRNVAVDAAGNVFVADLNNNRVRKLTAPKASPSLSGTATALSTATGTETDSASSTATGAASITRTITRTTTITTTSTGTASQTPAPTRTGTGTSTGTCSGTGTSTSTSTQTCTSTAGSTGTPTSSSTETRSTTATLSVTRTATASSTATGTETASSTVTSTESDSASSTATGAASITRTITRTTTITTTSTGTASQTPAPTRTGTSSQTGTGTISSSRTGTDSQTSTLSTTGSSTATGTGSQTSTLSTTGSQTGTPAPSGTRTASASLPRSPSSSKTSTPTQPVCRGLPRVVPLAGTSGTAPALSTLTAGQPDMYTAGTCAAGLRAFYPGSRLLYSLFLGATAPLGGTLTVTTCGHSANNTVLYVGTGCPTWGVPFGCLAGNDNAACGPNAFASTVSVVVDQLMYYLQVGGISGEHVSSGVAWSYAPPASASATRSRTASVTRTRSRTRKPKP